MNCRIFYNNVIRNANVTVNSEAASFEHEYLYDEIVGTKFRSSGTSQVIINMDLYASTAIKGIVLLDHNMEASDTTYEFEASNVSNFSSVAYSGTLQFKTRTVKRKNSNGVLENITRRDAYFACQWNCRYFRLRLKKASANVEIGGLLLLTGNYELEKNYNWGYTSGFERNFTSISNERGVVFKKQKYSRRIFTLNFSGLADDQKELMDEEVGENEFVVFFPKGYDGDLLYGTMEFDVPVHEYENSWSTNGNFTEII